MARAGASAGRLSETSLSAKFSETSTESARHLQVVLTQGVARSLSIALSVASCYSPYLMLMRVRSMGMRAQLCHAPAIHVRHKQHRYTKHDDCTVKTTTRSHVCAGRRHWPALTLLCDFQRLLTMCLQRVRHSRLRWRRTLRRAHHRQQCVIHPLWCGLLCSGARSLSTHACCRTPTARAAPSNAAPPATFRTRHAGGKQIDTQLRGIELGKHIDKAGKAGRTNRSRLRCGIWHLCTTPGTTPFSPT